MRSTFNILFFIKKNEVKRNGLCTIMVRITIEEFIYNLGPRLISLPDIGLQSMEEQKVVQSMRIR